VFEAKILLDKLSAMAEPVLKLARGLDYVHGANIAAKKREVNVELAGRKTDARREPGSAGSIFPLRPARMRFAVESRLLLIEGSVLLDKVLLLFGYVLNGVNRVGGASGNAGAAVDAALRIDIHLSRGFELRFVLLGMDAIGGADLDAERIFNAGISNYIGHDESISTVE
jgi:hypothetical protein